MPHLGAWPAGLTLPSPDGQKMKILLANSPPVSHCLFPIIRGNELWKGIGSGGNVPSSFVLVTSPINHN